MNFCFLSSLVQHFRCVEVSEKKALRQPRRKEDEKKKQICNKKKKYEIAFLLLFNASSHFAKKKGECLATESVFGIYSQIIL